MQVSNQYIEILKNNGINIEENSIYPIYKVSYSSGAIIRFIDENKGIVIRSSFGDLMRKGKHYSSLINHYREDHWRDLTNEEYDIYVKRKEFE